MGLKLKFLIGALVALAAVTIAPSALATVKIRALHAIPDVGAVTVYVNGATAVPSLDTLESTPYLELPEGGQVKLQVAPQGQPASAAVLEADVTLVDGKRYTALARGSLGAGSATLALQEDILRAPFASSSIRAWHLSPDAPAVDIYIDGQKAISKLAFPNTAGYVTLPPGSYDLRIQVADTDTVVLSQAVTIKRGEAYTVAALGSAAQPAAGAAFTVKPLLDATSGALVRAFHAIPDALGVTVYVNGAKAVNVLRTLRTSSYLALDAGTYTVAVAPRGKPASEAILRGKFKVADKQRYTIVARGQLAGKGAAKAALAAQQDIAVPAGGKGALRVWHLSPNAPRVDVFVNGQKVLNRVPFKVASKYFTLNPGMYQVKVTVSGKPNLAVFDGKIQLKKDTAVTAAAVGVIKANGQPKGLPFRISLLTDYR